jgi:hypothetical protein
MVRLGRRTDAVLLAALTWVASGADARDRDWARAVRAEASTLPGPARRRWLAGGVWFVARRRRATVLQRGHALAGLLFCLVLAVVPVNDLRDDAPDWAASSNAMLLTGTVLLGALFALALVRPLLAVVASPVYVVYGVLALTARHLEVLRTAPVAPPAGMAAPETAVYGGLVGLALAAVMLLGLPLAALAGVVLGARGEGEHADAPAA